MQPWESPPIIESRFAVPAALGLSFGPFDVADWWGLRLGVECASAALRVRLEWGWTDEFDNQGAIHGAGRHTQDFALAGGTGQHLHVAHQGPWLALYLTSGAAGGGWVSLTAANVNRAELPAATSNNGSFDPGQVLASYNTNVAGATTTTLVLPAYTGRAHAWARSASVHANTLVRVFGERYDAGGDVLLANLYRGAGTTAENPPRDIVLPGLVNRVELTNGDAGAQLFQMSIVAG